ncbi:MAG: Plug domain-containing protein, partial [Bacteroidales bacterium]|nr:Plug domain-containing protein [Bacteroidales bacterium]
MKRIMVAILVMVVTGMAFAQQNDTVSVAKSDTIAPKKTTELPEVGITAKKPVYMNDGEKTMYNVSEDPAVQSGTAADALQNAPGVEVDVEGNITLRGVSSVQIWLNNRPANMNAEALKILLQQMPASDIEKIEVIT